MRTTILLLFSIVGVLLIGVGLGPSQNTSEVPAPALNVRESPVVLLDVAPDTETYVVPEPSSARKLSQGRMLHQFGPVEDPEVLALTDRVLAAASAEEKGQCADALALSGSREAVESLITLAAQQDDPAHRAAILEGLNNLTATEGLTSLASVLAATQDVEILAAAAATLSRAGNVETLTALVNFYRERNDGPQQKNAVLGVIARLRSPDVQPALAQLAATAPEPALVEAARLSLETPHGD